MPNGTAGTVDIVVDVYHDNDADFIALKKSGIVGVIHKASQGMKFKDDKYHERRKTADEMKFLWGAYHFSSADDVEEQVKNFMDAIQFDKQRDAKTLLSLDFEPSGSVKKRDGKGKVVLGPDNKPVMVKLPNMTLDQANHFVELIHEKAGRWPVVYGGGLLRASVEHATSAIPLARCPLWYARYRNTPKELPTHVWPATKEWPASYALWQYTDGEDGPEPHGISGQGYDRDTFYGTEDELKEKWPF